MFASMYRSTQFCMQGSSERSSLPAEIFEVTHLRKHMSVKLCTYSTLASTSNNGVRAR